MTQAAHWREELTRLAAGGAPAPKIATTPRPDALHTPPEATQRARAVDPADLPANVVIMASKGFRCLPCKPRSKEATLKAWEQNATTNLDMLREMARQRPGCNWAAVADDRLILDVDDGAAFARLEEKNGALPRGPRIITKRGVAILFQGANGHSFHPQQKCPCEGIDLTTGPHYQMIPPSIHPSGQAYQWQDEGLPVPECPAWLLGLIAERQRPAPTSTVAGELRSGVKITEGGRTNRLVSLAGTLHKRGMAVEAIEAALIAENTAKCSPPLPESKVRAIAHDIPRRYPNTETEQPATFSPVPDAMPAEYADDALALKFTDRHADDLRFTAAWGHWSQWNGCVWRRDEDLHVFDRVRKVCRAESAGCENKRVASRIASAMTIAAVERLARSDRRHAATVSQWDRDPWALNTPDGVVDLRTGKMRPARREDYMTKTTAVGPGGECRLWLAFLSQITGGDEELQRYLQRMCGYAVTGVTREHALFFLYGTGANGKSVFLNTISGLLGGYAKTAPIEAFIDSKSERHPTDLAGLQGARLVTVFETEDGRRWAESKLKALTGGDRIAARFMRQDFFEFAPVFKLVVAGNHKPGLRTVDEAMRRRFNLLPFTVTIPAAERDLELTEKLRDEWGGILQWAIDGCLAWQSEGLIAPKAVKEATENYLAAEDALARWIEDCCERKDGAWEAATALFSSWKMWTDAGGEYAGSQKRFSENLAARGFAQARTKAARGFAGIRLRKSGVPDGGKPVSSTKNKHPEDTQAEGRCEL